MNRWSRFFEYINQGVTDAEAANRSLVWSRIDPEGPGLASPQRSGDVGWDLAAGYDLIIPVGTQIDVPTNIRVKLPPGCWGEMRARSSLAAAGLYVAATVIDNGFTGPLFVLLRNVGCYENDLCDWAGRATIRQGQRIAQLVIHQGVWISGVEIPADQWKDDPRRGVNAVGSTGTGLETHAFDRQQQ